MANNGKPHFSQNVFLRQSNGAATETLDAAVRQDKGRNKSARPGTAQPAPLEKAFRPQHSNSRTTRSRNRPTPRKNTVHLTLWVNPIVKAELQRIAEQEELSVSKVGAAFLERGLEQNIDMHYSALLDPIIKSAIHKHMGGMSNRLAWLLTRVAFDSEQTRAIATNILGRQQGMTEETLKTILAMSQRTAKGNLTRRSPEMMELIDAVEKWLLTDDEKTEPSN